MYKRILVAVDDTPVSRLAMKQAIKLAEDQKAKLCISYVADEYVPAGEGVPVDFKKQEAASRKKGKEILKKMLLMTKNTSVQVTGHLIEITERSDHVSQAIISYAKKWRADLIVLGSHRRGRLKRLILGSVADEIIQKTSIPVHLIRQRKKK